MMITFYVEPGINPDEYGVLLSGIVRELRVQPLSLDELADRLGWQTHTKVGRLMLELLYLEMRDVVQMKIAPTPCTLDEIEGAQSQPQRRAETRPENKISGRSEPSPLSCDLLDGIC